jgi:hypothetical protein
MSLPQYIKRPAALVSCILIACIAAALLLRIAENAHINAQTRAILQAIKLTPDFSHVYVRPGKWPLDLGIYGTVQTDKQFSALTNMLNAVASDMSIEVRIEWPTGRDYDREPGGMVGTRVGERGLYKKIGGALSDAVFFSFSVFLFVVVASLFSDLWRKTGLGQKRYENLLVLVLAPFISIALALLAFLCNLPSKGLEGRIRLLVPLSFLCSACLVAYSFRALVKGPYRLLSSVVLAITFIVAVPGCLGSAAMVADHFMQWLQ